VVIFLFGISLINADGIEKEHQGFMLVSQVAHCVPQVAVHRQAAVVD
jgi:hypothetical protein